MASKKKPSTKSQTQRSVPGKAKAIAVPRANAAREKALAVARTAEWLAELNELPPRAESAIERAYRALQVVREHTTRSVICQFLATAAANPNRDEGRSFFLEVLEAWRVAPDYCERVRISRLPQEQTVDAALTAWARARGAHAHGSEKWVATAALFKEIGFGIIPAKTLEKGWERRTGRVV